MTALSSRATASPSASAHALARPRNFYINDNRPRGGGGSSRSARAQLGTNDKAGSKLNLLRWTSARTIKETFVPPTDYRYPFMGPA